MNQKMLGVFFVFMIFTISCFVENLAIKVAVFRIRFSDSRLSIPNALFDHITCFKHNRFLMRSIFNVLVAPTAQTSDLFPFFVLFRVQRLLTGGVGSAADLPLSWSHPLPHFYSRDVRHTDSLDLQRWDGPYPCNSITVCCFLWVISNLGWHKAGRPETIKMFCTCTRS